MVNGANKLSSEMAELDNEIAQQETILRNLKREREAFVIVAQRLDRVRHAQPELIPALRGRKRGEISGAVKDVLSLAHDPMTVRQVKEELLNRGIRPNGKPANFPVTVAKALKRLCQNNEAEEITSGNFLSYRAVAKNKFRGETA